MKFTAGTYIVAGEEPIRLNEIDAKKQKELLKKYPHLEKYVVYEDDNKGAADDVEVQPKPKQRKRRKRKSKSE